MYEPEYHSSHNYITINCAIEIDTQKDICFIVSTTLYTYIHAMCKTSFEHHYERESINIIIFQSVGIKWVASGAENQIELFSHLGSFSLLFIT